MRWCLDRWRGRAALLSVLFAAVPVSAGPVNTTATPQAKIKEIEDAGELLLKGKVDDAYKSLQEAVKKKPDLPPARLMLARLLMNTKEGQQAARGVIEQAASENPDHPQVFLTLGSVALAENRLTETILDREKALPLSAADRWTKEQKEEVQNQA